MVECAALEIIGPLEGSASISRKRPLAIDACAFAKWKLVVRAMGREKRRAMFTSICDALLTSGNGTCGEVWFSNRH